MNDPQPTGYITLMHAYELYHGTWPEPQELAEKQRLMNEHLWQFKYALAHDQLRARVHFPDRDGEFDIPPQLWEVDGFPELEFLREDVPKHAPTEWSPYKGRTLFVRDAGFRQWLKHNGYQPPPDPKDFDDPAKMTTWTLAMAAAWIANRSMETVRWQMSLWREAHGWPHASLALVAAGALIDDDPNDPAHFESMESLKELTRKGENGEVAAWAVSSATGQPTQLQPSDWTYGKLEFGHNLDERWRVGNVVYTDITLSRSDVMRIWPETGSRPCPQNDGDRKLSKLQQAIAAAISEHWPDGLPSFPTNKERNAAIAAKVGRNISEDTFERFFAKS